MKDTYISSKNTIKTLIAKAIKVNKIRLDVVDNDEVVYPTHSNSKCGSLTHRYLFTKNDFANLLANEKYLAKCSDFLYRYDDKGETLEIVLYEDVAFERIMDWGAMPHWKITYLWNR